MGRELEQTKSPCLVVSSTFDFQQFPRPADFALAWSLFTHLPSTRIAQCLEKLGAWMQPGGMFFATFFESAVVWQNPQEPHDQMNFLYTRQQMEDMGREAGWLPEYIGQFGHPRMQVMVKYLRGE